MKHFLLSILLLLAASPGWAAPTMQGPNYLGAAQRVTWTFDTTTAASPIFGASGLCAATFVRAGGETVTLYQTTASTATGGTSIASFSATTTSPTALTIGQPNLYAVSDGATAGGKLTVHCSPLQVSSTGGGVDASVAMSGAYMTWGTVEYLADLKRFEGLDPTIPWTRFWINPYTGVDTNPGTYSQPIKTLGRWKELASFGTWFTIQNGGRPTPMYIGKQTFPYTITSGTCNVGEQISHNTTHDSKILDIDYDNRIMVVESLTATSLANATAFTGDESGCSWTTGTRSSGIWADNGSGNDYLCQTDNSDTCTAGQRYTSGAHCGAGECVASIEASISLHMTPTRYDGRIVSILDVEDPTRPVHVHGDKLSAGELDDAAIGAAGGGADIHGFFVAGNAAASSYGCLGVANISVNEIIGDAISQHQEGCVKTLNVKTNGIRNVSNITSNNLVTTHNGELDRGQVVVVNGGGYNLPYTNTAGAAVAPAGESPMTIIGIGDWITDGSIQNDTNGLATVSGNGGTVTMIGGHTTCRGMLHANGCQGFNLTTNFDDSGFNIVRVFSRTQNAAAASVSVSTTTYPAFLKVYRASFDGGRGIFTNASSQPITVDVRGSIFDDLDFYFYDYTTAANSANLTGSISGVYDNDGSNRWHFLNPGADYATAALADAAPVNVSVMSDSYSIQTDATEYVTSDSSYRCSSAGECFDSYTESFTLDFPEIIYDYLPVPIRGYTETGTRNYGAR